jgi:hypothetical protein
MTALTAMPSTIISGDSYEVQFSYTDYPATLWTGYLLLRGYSSASVTASASGTDYLCDLASSITTGLLPGMYTYALQAASGSARTTLVQGYTTVIANLTASTTTILHQEVMIRAIEAVLEDRVDDSVASMSINGRSLQYIPVPELLALRAQYYKELYVIKGGNSQYPRRIVPIQVNFT